MSGSAPGGTVTSTYTSVLVLLTHDWVRVMGDVDVQGAGLPRDPHPRA